MTTFNIFHTTRVRIGVRDAPHIWGAGEIRDAGERRLFGGLARSEPFVTPHVWGTGEMSTEISATYLGRCGNKHWKSRRIYVALGHDELRIKLVGSEHLPIAMQDKAGGGGIFVITHIFYKAFTIMFPTLLSRKLLATSISMWNIDVSAQGCSNTITNALGLLQSCTYHSI